MRPLQAMFGLRKKGKPAINGKARTAGQVNNCPPGPPRIGQRPYKEVISMIQPFLNQRRRLALVAILGGLVGCLAAGSPTLVSARPTNPDRKAGERVVFLAGNVAGDDRIVLAAAVAAARPQAVLLLDSPRATENTKTFLAAYQPDRVVPVGAFPAGLAETERRLGTKLTASVDWRNLFPKAERVIVCPPRPRGQLLQAACLAAALKAPL